MIWKQKGLLFKDVSIGWNRKEKVKTLIFLKFKYIQINILLELFGFLYVFGSLLQKASRGNGYLL